MWLLLHQIVDYIIDNIISYILYPRSLVTSCPAAEGTAAVVLAAACVEFAVLQ
jgi:hypothetical protein